MNEFGTVNASRTVTVHGIFNNNRLYRLYDIKINKRTDCWDCQVGTGLNKAPKFVVFRFCKRGNGIGSYIIHILKWLSHWQKIDAERIPIVDMKNYISTYLDDKEVGKIDAWQYFFEPISDYGLDEVYRAGDVVLAGYMYKDWNIDNEKIRAGVHGEKREFEYWSYLYKKYFRLNKTMSQLVLKYVNLLQFNSRRILGVKYRTTDYIYDLKIGHAYQATDQEMLDLTEEEMKKRNCDYVFLATDNLLSRNVYKEKFGEKLLYYDSELEEYNIEKVGIPYGEQAALSVGRRKSGEEYLLELILLSKCTSFLGCDNSGAIIAVIINDGKYESCTWVEHGYKTEEE